MITTDKENDMKKAPNNICPRCTGPVPNAERKGEYIGAMSRTDNETEVCSACGTAEAMEEFTGSGLTPQTNWPVNV